MDSGATGREGRESGATMERSAVSQVAGPAPGKPGQSANKALEAPFVCRVLPPAHVKQPYGRPVDEQRKHSGRRHEEGETAGVG